MHKTAVNCIHNVKCYVKIQQYTKYNLTCERISFACIHTTHISSSGSFAWGLNSPFHPLASQLKPIHNRSSYYSSWLIPLRMASLTILSSYPWVSHVFLYLLSVILAPVAHRIVSSHLTLGSSKKDRKNTQKSQIQVTFLWQTPF